MTEYYYQQLIKLYQMIPLTQTDHYINYTLSDSLILVTGPKQTNYSSYLNYLDVKLVQQTKICNA